MRELEGRVGYLMARVRHIAEDEGFVVNEAKSRVLRRSTAQIVTGLVVNDRPGVPARRSVVCERSCTARGPKASSARTASGRPDFVAWLRGKIAFVAMARPEVGRGAPGRARGAARKTTAVIDVGLSEYGARRLTGNRPRSSSPRRRCSRSSAAAVAIGRRRDSSSRSRPRSWIVRGRRGERQLEHLVEVAVVEPAVPADGQRSCGTSRRRRPPG